MNGRVLCCKLTDGLYKTSFLSVSFICLSLRYLHFCKDNRIMNPRKTILEKKRVKDRNKCSLECFVSAYSGVMSQIVFLHFWTQCLKNVKRDKLCSVIIIK